MAKSFLLLLLLLGLAFAYTTEEEMSDESVSDTEDVSSEEDDLQSSEDETESEMDEDEENLFFKKIEIHGAREMRMASGKCDTHTDTLMECFSYSGTWAQPKYQPTLWDMTSIGEDSMKRLWGLATCPKVSDLRGNAYNGIILDLKFSAIGRKAYQLYSGTKWDILGSKFRSQPFTFQKRFHTADVDGKSGINYWAAPHAEKFPMKIYTSDAFHGSGESLKVDYNIKQNQKVTVRPLLDEIRNIPGTSLFIGRMYYRIPLVHTPVFFLWFALEKNVNGVPYPIQ